MVRKLFIGVRNWIHYIRELLVYKTNVIFFKDIGGNQTQPGGKNFKIQTKTQLKTMLLKKVSLGSSNFH